ncbi:MAG: phosphatase PAP2 family protein [Ilumatobacteraceae bacterium]
MPFGQHPGGRLLGTRHTHHLPMTLWRVHARRPWLLPALAATFVVLAVLARFDALPWDGPITEAVVGARGPTLDRIARRVSFLGSTRVVFLVSGTVALIAWPRSPRLAIAIVVIALARPLTEFVIKEIVGRERPVGDRLVRGRGPSFPSGHPFAAAASWGTLPLLVPLYSHSRRVWWVVAILAWTIIVMVGIARVYLGVHWATDVVAGVILAILGVAFVERVLRIEHRPA